MAQLAQQDTDKRMLILGEGITLSRILEALFDYVEVEHPKKEPKPGERNNDVGALTFYMAKLVYLFLAIYPEALIEYKEGMGKFFKEVVTPFVESTIQKYWPGLDGALTKELVGKKGSKYDPILDLVSDKIDRLNTLKGKHSPIDAMLKEASSSSDDDDLDPSTSKLTRKVNQSEKQKLPPGGKGEGLGDVVDDDETPGLESDRGIGHGGVNL